MTPEERKAMHWCSQHKEEPCGLVELCREGWEKYADRAGSTEVLRCMLSVDRDEPEHAAAYSENQSLKELQKDVRTEVGRQKRRKAGK